MSLATKKIVVCDIDGCLIDSRHRSHHYFNGEEDLYFQKVHLDTPILQGQYVYKAFAKDPAFHLLFVTSRGDWDHYRELTLNKLREYVDPRITNEQLIMRPVHLQGLERLPDEEYKPKAVQDAGYSIEDIFIAFDDKEAMVDKWRSLGVVCYHTQPGAY